MHYDDIVSNRYNMAVPEIGIRQITGGFRKWAQRYLFSCRGQIHNNFQVNRMDRWKNVLTAKYHYFQHN